MIKVSKILKTFSTQMLTEMYDSIYLENDNHLLRVQFSKKQIAKRKKILKKIEKILLKRASKP